MRRKSVFMAGMLALLLAFGLVLAGCSLDGDDDNDGDKKPAPKSGTIKLTETATNVFTITLTGFVFKADIEDIYVPSLTQHLEVDGTVTAEATGGNDNHRRIVNAGSEITFSVVRTSDTVLTITMSERKNGPNWHFGSGKLKFDSRPFDFPNRNGFIQDCVYEDSLTVAQDSGSVSFDIPEHQE
jgi:hypothetical protein